MTREEADQVAAILSSADGGCSVCGVELAKAAALSFQIKDFNWLERVAYWRENFWRTSIPETEVKQMRQFVSESGDTYLIPDAQYADDVAAYRAAVERGDEPAMLYYEEGRSGWRAQSDGEVK